MHKQDRFKIDADDLLARVRKNLSQTGELCTQASRILEATARIANELREQELIQKNVTVQLEELRIHTDWIARQAARLYERLRK
jgi:hypothetical protein